MNSSSTASMDEETFSQTFQQTFSLDQNSLRTKPQPRNRQQLLNWCMWEIPGRQKLIQTLSELSADCTSAVVIFREREREIAKIIVCMTRLCRRFDKWIRLAVRRVGDYRRPLWTYSRRLQRVVKKVKVHSCIHLIQRLFVVNHHVRSAQVWYVFSRDFTVLPAHPHVHPQSEWAIPAFAFPAITVAV